MMIDRITKDEFGTSAPLAQNRLLQAVPFTHLGLFEGIGGFSLAARWMGWETLAWCEWNEFGQKVLRHHFPKAEGFGDITKTDFTKYANTIDILTGGFPCQPYSVAGKRKGKEDERHLWPEMLRAIREVNPTFIVGENVSGIVNWNRGMVFNEVQRVGTIMKYMLKLQKT
jgi:DNA (cytosine-5)-methyltransferase 1